jgi:transglutaminase-like putative cysteine protease
MEQFLASTEVIDWRDPRVFSLARELAEGRDAPQQIAQRCFEWVRDEIKHSSDYQLNPVTCTASEVLAAGTGFCYAKSHLLAALLRANGIAAGLCYQRLSIDGNGPPFCLHGLNAVHLPEVGWYRIDPRGNKPGVDAQFVPPREQLAFTVQLRGEADLPNVSPEPLPSVVQALRRHKMFDALLQNLPDI